MATFLCDCGRETLTYVGNVKKGHTRSCGCLKETRSRNQASKIEYAEGDRLHSVTFIRDAPSLPKQRKAVFRCDCGNEFVAYINNVKKGNSKSCGCIRDAKRPFNNLKHGRARIGDRAYKSWTHMLGRCNNPKDAKYPDYGARGISVCERWLSFENFLEDMGDPPRGTTIDRKENDGNYEKSNCRWATPTQQANNRRSSRFLEFEGERLTVAEWSRKRGIDYSVLLYRINAGWSAGKALSEPIRVW
ncbi:hypothetical protein [Caballeronia sp. KNU42]